MWAYKVCIVQDSTDDWKLFSQHVSGAFLLSVLAKTPLNLTMKHDKDRALLTPRATPVSVYRVSPADA
jgi:hypothetical protein